MNSFVKKLKQIVIIFAVTLLTVGCSQVPSLSYNPWEVISLPTEAVFSDIAFTEDFDRGWLVGSKAALFGTTDGGNTWEEKNLNLGDEKVSFTSVSFAGEEGWVSGKPSILLHTQNGGETWERIPLSEKLPGSPYNVEALGNNSAEMTTDLGAIYETKDGGRTWKALVEGAVGVARNISRSQDGKYVAVSAKGNFYSTWEPGQSQWTPHNRNSSRRLQSMGFGKDGRIWLLARGGQVQFSAENDFENWEDPINPEFSTSWGLLDIGYRTPEEIWVAGGSGNLLCSLDGGETWLKDREVEEVPTNLYKIIFLTPEKGFVLGQRGYLLKYNPQSEPPSATA
ncbi:MAG: photosynthesis system II assembly factor Ycf48 [Oscillatoria sp. PMC 1068.18]|nr:photosynthesis system II assembly factor Ycf48 [Oscillatoria sp. PMC 1076.18]MEC4987732.1 photosynthesis system II assembly factor Ycf48 [Oscillatoria sp. PMC 1068.18]